MPVTLPFLAEGSLPRTVFDILKLERAQGSLPESQTLLRAGLVAFGVSMAGTQMFEHSLIGSIIFGVVATAALYGLTYLALRYGGSTEKMTRTLTALGITGAIGGLAYILLHITVGLALPPPMPTDKLLRFLLFPVAIWNVFMFAFLYRNARLRPMPSFAFAGIYVAVLNLILSPLCK